MSSENSSPRSNGADAQPGACMRPASMSAAALSALIFGQMLRVRTGVKRCRKCWSSSPFFWPSIQRQQSAISTEIVAS